MRAAIIGLGAVGEACAHLLVARETARSLVLANRTRGLATAIRMDLEQSRAWSTPLSARDMEPWAEGAFRGCDVIILAAGPRLRGDEKRADKARQSARLLAGDEGESIVDALAEHVRLEDKTMVPEAERSILLVVTNPVEATVSWLAERTGWARRRIMGLGTTVETARFSRFLADTLDVDAPSVWTEIIGEHGELIALRDSAAVEQRASELGKAVDINDLLTRTRRAAGIIRDQSEAVGRQLAMRFLGNVESHFDRDDVLVPEVKECLEEKLAAALSPPATRFAIAASVVEVVEAILADRGRVLPVSGHSSLEGMPDVAIAVPFVVGRAGLLDTGLDGPTEYLREVAQSVREQVDAMREEWDRVRGAHVKKQAPGS